MMVEQDPGLPRFVFAMLEVTYKQVSDYAFQRGMTVQEFVSRAIDFYLKHGPKPPNQEKPR